MLAELNYRKSQVLLLQGLKSELFLKHPFSTG